MAHIHITSFNVRGINNAVKKKDVFDYLKRMDSDIYCLQDIHCGSQQEHIFKNNWDGEMVIACGTNNLRGVAILFGKKIEYTILDTKLDTGGNYVALKIKMIETEVTLVSIYGPNMDDPYFCE